jgi:pimeloyl-[acyl-carrier protein] methyl ester esterase
MPKTAKNLTKNTDIKIAFVHGWGMNSGAFTQLIDALQGELEKRNPDNKNAFSLYTITLPGHGEKHDLVPEPFDLPAIADHVAEQLKENTIIVAWSLGGLVAQYLASRHHQKLIGLMTIASTPKFQMEDDWPGIKPEVLQLFMTQLEQNHHKTLSRFLAIQMMGVENAKRLIKEITTAIELHPAPNIRALAGGLKILQEADIREAIGNINIPTLRTYGRLDSLVPYTAINRIQQLQPASQHLIFKHASHAPFLTDPLEFSKHTADFITQISTLSD